MNEIQNGLYLVEEEMPCFPRAIRIGHYFLPNTLGRAEQEEAAARIVYFSHDLEKWVGVSWTRIVEMMREDYKKHVASNERLDRHNELVDVWFKQLRRHFWFCVFTLGIYALLVGKPQRPVQSIEETDLPFTGIYLFGPEHVAVGIHELIGRGMLKKVTEGEGNNIIEVLFPTPSLISRIMAVQGVTA